MRRSGVSSQPARWKAGYTRPTSRGMRIITSAGLTNCIWLGWKMKGPTWGSRGRARMTPVGGFGGGWGGGWVERGGALLLRRAEGGEDDLEEGVGVGSGGRHHHVVLAA